jgi:hypothetical protein
MKKFLAILLLLIYVTGVTGIGIAGHICCHPMNSAIKTHEAVHIQSVSDHSEPSVSAEDCCKTIHTFFKVNNVLEPSGDKITFLAFPNHLFAPVQHMPLWNDNLLVSVTHLFNSHSPPGPEAFPLFLHDIILLI